MKKTILTIIISIGWMFAIGQPADADFEKTFYHMLTKAKQRPNADWGDWTKIRTDDGGIALCLVRKINAANYMLTRDHAIEWVNLLGADYHNPIYNKTFYPDYINSETDYYNIANSLVVGSSYISKRWEKELESGRAFMIKFIADSDSQGIWIMPLIQTTD